MWFTETNRIWITAFLLCTLAKGFALAQQEKQYLDAGKDQSPFDVSRHSVPIEEILPGGPPKDGIPALNRPKFVSTSDGNKFLKKHDRVLAIEYNGVAKAYPIRILNWHEVVNDDFDGKPVVVTWCPLCLSGIVYDPKNEGNKLTFGVSGKIYKSNLLMYDHETGSRWSQMQQRAITGPLSGPVLGMLPAEHSTWEHWRAQHPETLIRIGTTWRRGGLHSAIRETARRRNKRSVRWRQCSASKSEALRKLIRFLSLRRSLSSLPITWATQHF